MTYAIAPLDLTPAELDGLSERLIVSHYENNYGGAVRRLNAIAGELGRLDHAGAANFTLNGLKREELIAANSMILHEVYFGSLGGRGEATGELAEQLERDFGSIAAWRSEFAAMGKALGGGSGWVLLACSPRDRKLVNQWAADHAHVLAGSVPVLALDMYEHAYHLDFGAKAAAYVDAFMHNIDWQAADRRFAAALGKPVGASPHDHGADLAPEALRDRIAAGQAPLILDVRRRKAFDAGSDMIQGAEWRQPEIVQDWVASVPRGVPVAVYCVYGHNVSHDTVTALRAAGVDAQALRGGIAAWHAIGGPVVAKN